MLLLKNEHMWMSFSVYLGLFLPDNLQEICQELFIKFKIQALMDFNCYIGLESSCNLTCNLLCGKNWESKSNGREEAEGKSIYKNI